MLKPIYFWIERDASGARSSIAAFLLVAAMLQVANTIRLAAFARRRGDRHHAAGRAPPPLHPLPFLMEALVAALVGVGLAAGALVLFM